ncbi:hypothetical protein Q2941_12075 [Bradyrhizobium sp. UFLA05-153]
MPSLNLTTATFGTSLCLKPPPGLYFAITSSNTFGLGWLASRSTSSAWSCLAVASTLSIELVVRKRSLFGKKMVEGQRCVGIQYPAVLGAILVGKQFRRRFARTLDSRPIDLAQIPLRGGLNDGGTGGSRSCAPSIVVPCARKDLVERLVKAERAVADIGETRCYL